MPKFVERSEIEDETWNELVCRSTFFRHYYLTYYLDHAASDWCALIDDKNEWVWPLPFKKVPIKQVFQPLLCQQLGPIGRPLNDQELKDAINLIKERYRLWSVKFSDSYASLPFKRVVAHRNIELDLGKDYTELFSNFKRNVRSGLKKFEKSGLSVLRREHWDPWVIEAFKASRGSAISALDDVYYEQVKDVFNAFLEKGEAFSLGVVEEEETICQLLVLHSNQRLLFFFSNATERARAVGAMQATVDHLIQMYAGSNITLDFEGSDNDNLAHFYEGFGGEERLYLQSDNHTLLAPIRKLFKR